ncbi:MAG: TonB-dependent receptor [bacterium]|nr:TonB-dependent receptor [bacterium]
MRILFLCFLLSGLWADPVVGAPAQETDIFDFFEAEAEAVQVVTVSRLRHSRRQAPATVYVVSAEDLKLSGAKTLWDALRHVPGVDVLSTRTFYGEVSIRGLNKALSNRTLVLMDGRSVLDGPFDTTFWEGIPVVLEEIDRIEVVEGPASALYGANAINGVINIVTRTPQKMDGGQAEYSVGQYSTHLASAVYGDRSGRVQYRVGAGWRSTNRFEDTSLDASDVGKFDAYVSYDLPGGALASVSGGLAEHETQFSTGGAGAAIIDGHTGFLRADVQAGQTRFRTFWNAGRLTMRGFQVQEDPIANSDTYDLNLERTFEFSARNQLVVGGSYRHNRMRSNVYVRDRVSQNFWALFFEDAWRPVPTLSVVTSLRLDRHTRTGWSFSPRGSVVFSPLGRHTFRISAGGSFRNPTLTEAYMAFSQAFQTGSGALADNMVMGDPNLEPERLVQVEVAHLGDFGVVKTTAVLFHYRLKDVITATDPELVVEALPELRLLTPFANLDGQTRAWGGELGVEVAVSQAVKVFANYSYQRFSGTLDIQASENGGPRHKFNVGFRAQQGGWTADVRLHAVDRTFWSGPNFQTLENPFVQVDGYVLLNAHIGYTFSGLLKGWTLSTDVFNLTDHKHFQVLPASSRFEPGRSGEVMRRRLTATVSYGF